MSTACFPVTIKKVEKGVELTLRGGVKKNAPVVHFEGKDRPLVLNKTNTGSLASILGNKPSTWAGKKVVIYPTTTRMYKEETKQMETVGCIRIKGAKGK